MSSYSESHGRSVDLRFVYMALELPKVVCSQAFGKVGRAAAAGVIIGENRK